MTFPEQPDSFDTYGGEKSDYIAVVDPSTDRSAEEIGRAFLSTAMMTATPCQTMLQFTSTAGPNLVPNYHTALWGSTIALIPVVTVTGTGILTLTFPSSFVDGFGATVAVNLSMGQGSLEGSAFGFVNVTYVSANSFEIRLADSTGTLSELTNVVVNIWVY